jgi:hypothetical protein
MVEINVQMPFGAKTEVHDIGEGMFQRSSATTRKLASKWRRETRDAGSIPKSIRDRLS